jgi:hypothetical protein
MRKRTFALFWLGCLFLLVACGGEEPVVATLIPTVISDTAVTAVPTPTTSLPETATPLPPPPTIAPIPTSTSAPEEVSVSDAILLLSPADFGDDRNPLTGEVVDDPSVLQRRPLAIKISNAPPNYVRPQSGLNDADFVYEHTAEGSITRFTAIIYGRTPPRVGPIRSARLIDIELPAMYDAALAFSGASTGVSRRLNASDFETRIIRSNEPGYYRTGEDKPLEHTLYGNPVDFWQTLEAKGLNMPPNFGTTLAFSSEPPPGGTPASAVTIDYNWEVVEWRYDPENGRYWRWAAGVPHLDGNTDEQVNAANIIIIAPFHVEDPTICEEIRNGTCLHLSVEIQLWGSGSGIILRDGQQYPVNWHRESRNDLLTFTDNDGNPFPLQIGNSWVQLVPTWYQDPVSVTP